MAKKRIKCRLVVPNQTDGLTVGSALTTSLVGKDLFLQDLIPSVLQNEDGAWSVNADVRFNLGADADIFFANIQDKWTVGALKNKILASSVAMTHVCRHDEATPRNCADSIQSNFSRVVKV